MERTWFIGVHVCVWDGTVIHWRLLNMGSLREGSDIARLGSPLSRRKLPML